VSQLSRWIGVDLDGTLAHYTGWRGAEHIGVPIPAMLERVQAWVAAGVTVKIFTARASVPEYIPYIVIWLEKHRIGGL
jgi:hydroxymethylpyrimidine pyrophosphatase-like HAD family hydrolase